MSQRLEAHSQLPVDQIILDAIEQSDLRPIQKLRARAKVFFKSRGYDELAAAVLEELYVAKVVDEDGQVQSAIDWAQILAIIIPLLLEWFSGRFGSRR